MSQAFKGGGRSGLTEGLGPRLDAGFFADNGYLAVDDFIGGEDCRRFLAEIERFGRENKIAEVDRPDKERSLRYSVINGVQIAEGLPEIQRLYLDLADVVSRIASCKLLPLENRQAGVNVNITKPGGEYRWHYDRNRLTAILYLNSVEGGEIEFFPNYRLHLGRFRYSALQQRLDNFLKIRSIRNFFRRRVLFRPHPGSLLLMRADRCLHSVRPVLGDADRINIVMAYDLPGADFEVEEKLDSYLYNDEFSSRSDPNYK